MADSGGFEGNAQTLRILTELIYERPGSTKGIAPTRAFLDGVMKYKALQSEWITRDAAASKNHFIYDEQVNWRDTILNEGELPAALQEPKALNQFKSIECQIMDWADDSAYSLHDIVDGIHARYLTIGSIGEWANAQDLTQIEQALLDTLCTVIRENRYEPYFGSRIGHFVHACSLALRSGTLSDQTNRHAFQLEIDPEVVIESKLYKALALDLIFRSTQLQQIEFKGGHILEKTFRALEAQCLHSGESGLNILPASVQALLDAETDPAARKRRLCDYLAGLTDGQAVRTYKRLFHADFGSIAELV
jgi:dGTPase